MIVMWLLGFAGCIWLIPRERRREGFLAFVMFQAFIWLCDMPAFQYNLLSAPVREFPKATDLAITINYFFYPVLFSIFYVRRRAKTGLWFRFVYFFLWISLITLFDNLLETYTHLLEYGRLTWFGMWLYIGFLFYVSQVSCDWFFKERSLFQAERRGIQ